MRNVRFCARIADPTDLTTHPREQTAAEPQQNSTKAAATAKPASFTVDLQNSAGQNGSDSLKSG
jgi:hypothetical protein